MVKLELVSHSRSDDVKIVNEKRKSPSNEAQSAQCGSSKVNGDLPTTSAKIEVPVASRPIDYSWRVDIPSTPLRVQHLKKHLDTTRFVNQLEKLLAQPIKIPSSSVLPQSVHGKTRHSLFSVKGVWNNEADRLTNAAKLYNMKKVGNRTWLRDLLLEESDSESEAEMVFTQRDLHALLKIHRRRRKLQHQYHEEEAVNQQYTYYAAGLLSIHDPFPDHQAAVLRQHSTQRT